MCLQTHRDTCCADGHKSLQWLYLHKQVSLWTRSRRLAHETVSKQFVRRRRRKWDHYRWTPKPPLKEMILNGEFVLWLSHRIKAGPMDSGLHNQVQFPVPSHIRSFFTWLWDNSLHFSLHLSFPPKGIKSYSLNRRMRVSSRGSVGVTSSASWNDASPVPAGYDPKDLLRNCAPCRSPARGGRAFCASLWIRDFVVSSSLHLSSRSSHSWLHLRTALNHTKL